MFCHHYTQLDILLVRPDGLEVSIEEINYYNSTKDNSHCDNFKLASHSSYNCDLERTRIDETLKHQ